MVLTVRKSSHLKAVGYTKVLPDMQQHPQDVLKTLQHAHTKSSVDQTSMQLH